MAYISREGSILILNPRIRPTYSLVTATLGHPGPLLQVTGLFHHVEGSREDSCSLWAAGSWALYAQHVYSPISYLPPQKHTSGASTHKDPTEGGWRFSVFLLLLTWDTGEQERDTIGRIAMQSEGQITEIRQRSSCLRWNKDQEVSKSIAG